MSRSWPAAVHEGAHLDLAPHDQRADAVGATDLVPGEGQRVDPARREVDRDGPDCLHRVGVHRDAVEGGDLGHLLDRLERADLVVGPHHRDHRHGGRVALDRLAQRLDLEATPVVDGQQLDLGDVALGQPHQRVQDRVVLDGGAQDPGPPRIAGPACPEDPLQREVVGLGATRGEDDVARPAAQGLGDGLARLLHDAAGVPAGGVQRAGVADVGQVGRHGLDGRREHRGGRGVVEIDGRLIHRIPQRTACREANRAHVHPGVSVPAGRRGTPKRWPRRGRGRRACGRSRPCGASRS